MKVEAKRKTLGIIKRVVDWHDRKSVILKRHSCVVGVLHIVSIAEECKRKTEGRGTKREREEARQKRSHVEKKGEESGNDIINDFSVVISVFTDLDSSL